MIRLACDYQEGCHPKILEKLVQTNLESTPGYGKAQKRRSARLAARPKRMSIY